MIKKGYITLVFSILLLFLGTLLINIKNNTLTNEEYQLDFSNTIFLNCIKNGYDSNKSYGMVRKILKNDINTICFQDFISEKILIKCKKRKEKNLR